MKKYNNPQIEMICLNTADVIASSGFLQIFDALGEFGNEKKYNVDENFWG